MEKNKRFGAVAIATSIVLAVASIVFSENLCYAGSPSSESWVTLALVCLRVNVYEEMPGSLVGEHFYLPTKYLLLACVALLAVGTLWYLGALPVPSGRTEAKSQEPQGPEAGQ